MKISYPFKPFIITQAWGNPNGTYSDHFHDPNFTLHNGIDAFSGRYNYDGSVMTEFPVYCPVEGFLVESVTFDANGGGNQLSLISKEPVQMGDVTGYARIFLCHAKKILLKVGYEPALGELLMIADNTGFSTGLHTHMGLYRLDVHKKKVDSNQATGSYNPAVFFTNQYAVDQASLSTLITSGLRYYQYKLGLT